MGTFAGAGGAALNAACDIDPKLNHVTVNQGLPYPRLVRGKETLVRFYFSLPTSIPRCGSTSRSIKIVSATLNVKNGSTVLNTAPIPAQPEAINAEITNTAPTTKSPSVPANSPADPKFAVPGSVLKAGTAGASYAASFEATVTYQSKGNDGVFTANQTATFPPAGTTPITATVEAKTKVPRILVVPMGGALDEEAAAAVGAGMTHLSRLFPVPDGTDGSPTAPRTAELTNTTAGVLRYTVNSGVVDMTGLLDNTGKFCGTSNPTQFARIQTQLIAFRNAWNGVVNTTNGPVDFPEEQDSDKVVGVIPASKSHASTSTSPSGCLEGFAMTNSNETWIRAVPGMAGPLFAMEICHTFGCVPDTGTFHSLYTQADNEDPDRAYNVLDRSYIQNDRTAMRLITPWGSENTVMEKAHYAYLLCGFGGAATNPCPTAPATGTLTGVAATTGSAIAMYGTTDGPGGVDENQTVSSMSSLGAPVTVPDPASPYRLVQKDDAGTVLGAGTAGLGIPVRFAVSHHGSGADSGSGALGSFNVAYPAEQGVKTIELRFNNTVLYSRTENNAPEIGDVSAGGEVIGFWNRADQPRTIAVHAPDAGSNCEITQPRSTEGTTPSVINFVNESGRTVDLHWLDYNGERVFYATIASGATHRQETWLTHPWVMVDAAGRCIGYTVSTSLEQTYVIGKPLDVNEDGDEAPDGSCDPFDVDTAADCTLREAILEANARAGKDTISFDIPGDGTHTISPTSPLPTITDAVTINGTTQHGFSGSPIIELNGAGAGLDTNGLLVNAGPTTIRGLVINRFDEHGIFVTAGAGAGNTIQGNYIGTNVAGTADLGNGREGIRIESPSAVVGGTTAAARNLSSGNGGHGILIFGSTNSVVQGNYAGTNAAGTAGIPNGIDGIIVDGGGNNTIGGTAAGAGNLASGNWNQGIAIAAVGAFTTSTDNVVQGNKVGTNAAGTGAIPNGVGGSVSAGDGIRVHNASNTTVGGTAPGAANIVAHNRKGVAVFADAGKSATGNRISQNEIHSNTDIGIDLARDGVTANDPPVTFPDFDTGPNNRQNFPVLRSVVNGTISGHLDSTPDTTFTIEFFSNHACDTSGNGEGARFLGSRTVTTNGSGRAQFTSAPPLVATGEYVTATATDPSGNTSEFSACRQAIAGAAGTTPVTIVGEDETPGNVRAFVFANCGGRQEPIVVDRAPSDTAGNEYFIHFDFDPKPACAGPNGELQLTVVTTDGFQTSLPETVTVESTNERPAPAIATDGPFVQWDGITLHGTAFDADEQLDADDLTWTSPLFSGPKQGFAVKLVPTPSWTPGSYEVTLRATDSAGAFDEVTKTITILKDSDHDGCTDNGDDLDDNNRYDAYQDADNDGRYNCEDAAPNTPDDSFTGTATFSPDPFPLPYGGVVTMTMRLLNKNVADVLASSVRLKRIDGEDVSTDNAFKATSVAVTSTGVLRATFSGTAISNFLTGRGVHDRRILVTMGGDSKTSPKWSFEGTGSTYVD